MKLTRVAGGFASLFVALILAGCGDVYRPVVNPFQTPGGDPQDTHTAFVISKGVVQPDLPNGIASTCTTLPCPGGASKIDVSGDTVGSINQVGDVPWNAYATSTLIFVANRDDDNLSTWSTLFSGSPSTISLPQGSSPVYVTSTQTDAVYVAMPGTNPSNNGNVGVISTTTNALTATIPVGRQPVAMAETPNKQKLYVVNKLGNGSGKGTVSVVATVDNTVLGNITVGTAPVWAIATPDGNYVFVLNRGSNTISVLSTSNDQNEVAQVDIGGSSADMTDVPPTNLMFYDGRLQRLYVPNSTSGTLSVFDASNLPSLVPLTAPIELAPGSASSPEPVSVTVLPDGSRAYVANRAAGTVSVVNARSFTVNTIPVGSETIAVSSSLDGTKVYAVSTQDTIQGGSVVPGSGTTIINTASDSIVLTVPAPYQDPVNCPPPAWAASTAYSADALILPKNQNGFTYQVSTAGTSGTSEPTWCTTAGCTVNDGSVVWTEIGATSNFCPRQQSWFVTQAQ